MPHSSTVVTTVGELKSFLRVVKDEMKIVVSGDLGARVGLDLSQPSLTYARQELIFFIDPVTEDA